MGRQPDEAGEEARADGLSCVSIRRPGSEPARHSDDEDEALPFLCLLVGVLAFGVGSAASWLLSRTAQATFGDGGAAAGLTPELVAVVQDDAVDSSGTARIVHVGKYEVTIADDPPSV